jgi:VWFA-related protein
MLPRPLPVAIVLAAAMLTAQTTPQQRPVFRTGVVSVPIDVRVLDRDGKAVTDLTAADFTILENGVPQEIRYFAAQPLTASAPEAGVAPRRFAEPATLAPQNRRLFLIVLGRGRLQEPSKGLDALLRFVRERLLPQDQVALMAWNRATDFTTDHAKIAGVIARFRAKHEEIEAFLRDYFSGLSGLYAGRKMPAHIQTRIDDVFNDPLAGAREVLPNAAAMAPAEAEARRQTNDILNASGIETFRQFGGTDSVLADLMSDSAFGMDFDEYIALSRQTMQDVGNLYAGIDYLRFIDGEKHLVFLTEQGFLLPSADLDRDVAAIAADARVAIDTIQTGGVHTVVVNGMPQIPPQIGFQLRALRTVSEISGGQVSTSTHAETAFDRILSATGFGYLLGYTPATPLADGRFRRLEVRVNRRNVNLAYRRGYYARPEPESFDPRRSLAMTRIVTAANYSDDVRDLRIAMKTQDVRQDGIRHLKVDVTVTADRVVLALARSPEGYRHLAALNVAVFCRDAEGRSLGEVWKSLDIPIPATDLDRIKTSGLTFSIEVPVTRPPTFVKVVVYDYGSDLVGSKYARLH